MTTTITDIVLRPNGEDSAYFGVVGEDFECGFDVGHGGLGPPDKEDVWFNFIGYMGHRWKIKRKGE
jgi:hypothetical protein